MDNKISIMEIAGFFLEFFPKNIFRMETIYIWPTLFVKVEIKKKC